MKSFLDVHLRNVRIERDGHRVIDAVSWRIRPGQRWVLLGRNGAGKTQLLKLVAGAVWPAATGRESRFYRWRGELWRQPQGIQEEVAYIGAERQDKYERYGWNHRVEQIVGTGLYRTDIPLDPLTEADRKRIGALLRRFHIEHLTGRHFLTLSYGERRLVLLARAVATRPKLLLLDEVFNGLDSSYRERIQRWLQTTARSALPWVLATHRADDVPKAATHVLAIEDGRIVYSGTRSKAPLTRWLEAGNERPAASARLAAAPKAQSEALLVSLRRASIYLEGTIILKNISLQLRAGECWVVHGRNGAGKSTLLRALYGDHAICGEVKRAGIVPGVALDAFKQLVGWIAPHLQADHPHHLTVDEVVQSGRYASIGLNDPATGADRAAAARALSFFGLTHLQRHRVGELSYGLMRRVLFARAWIRKPRLLLLDEPFSGIDANTRTELLACINRMVREGTAVVMATHHANEWPASTTHELALEGGRMKYCGAARIALARVNSGA